MESSWNPAPYGQACTGCVRAKCKCFIQQGGKACERCQRLGKPCESSGAARRRRVRRQQQQEQQNPSSFTQIEQHLDEVVSLLRRQTTQPAPAGGPNLPVRAERSENNTPSSAATLTVDSYNPPRSPTRPPELSIDANSSHLHMSRAIDSGALSEWKPLSSPIYDDVLKHDIPESVAQERLRMFHEHFLPMFPFVHIPISTHPLDLRQQKPFLWLVIMCLTATAAQDQFKLEATIWDIIGRRAVVEHHASLDLVLGLIGFSAWSHYFKNDKPFMTTLTGLAVSMVLELNLHKHAPTKPLHPNKHYRVLNPAGPNDHDRSLEERRTFIALFHVSSATWTAYRKTDPLKCRAYLTECIRIVGEGKETHLDTILVSQVKCQILDNQLTRSIIDDDPDGQASGGLSVILLKGMLDSIEHIQQNLPIQAGLDNATELYLLGTKLTIQDFILRAPYRYESDTGVLRLKRLQDLDTTLTLVERWIATWFRDPVPNFRGATVDIFTQFLHCLVILFKLVTVDEPGWNVAEVWRRANVFNILDRVGEILYQVASTVGMIDSDAAVDSSDSDGQSHRRHGLFFKTQYLLRAIKTMFLAELEPEDRLMIGDGVGGSGEGVGDGGWKDGRRPGGGGEEDDGAGLVGGTGNGDFDFAFDDPNWVPDDLVMSATNEPWLAEIYMPSWDVDFDSQLAGQIGF